MTFRPTTGGDKGFTLVEFIVSSAIFALVLTFIGTSIASSKRAADDVTNINRINEEARTTINRISRELRQARDITSVIDTSGSAGGDGKRGFTFEADFNGDGIITPNSDTSPEVITYSYDPASTSILLSAADSTGAITTFPVLSGKVTAFVVGYHSSYYKYDCNGDGVTDWTEIDAASCPTPNRPPPTPLAGDIRNNLDQNELRFVDSVTLSFTVSNGRRSQDYRTQVDLRNAAHATN